MSFVELPVEILLTQLRSLPIADLLLTCQTNTQVAEICNSEILWKYRIKDEFPDIDINQVVNPKEFYLSRVLFGGQIYVHSLISPDTYQTQLLPYQTILYDQLFNITRQIAENANQPYVILYSRPVINYEMQTFSLDLLYFQTSEGVGNVLNSMGRIKEGKITQVDILVNIINQGTLDTLEALLIVQKLPSLGPGQSVSVGYKGRTITYDKAKIKFAIQLTRKTIIDLSKKIIEIHESNNTPLYQWLLQQNPAIRRSIFQNPKIPQSMNVISGNIAERKQKLLNEIIQTMSQISFDRGLERNSGIFMGFKSYQDFLTFQQDYINALNEGQMQILEFTISQLLPSTSILDEEHEHVTSPEKSFVFDSKGNIVLILPR